MCTYICTCIYVHVYIHPHVPTFGQIAISLSEILQKFILFWENRLRLLDLHLLTQSNIYEVYQSLLSSAI